MRSIDMMIIIMSWKDYCYCWHYYYCCCCCCEWEKEGRRRGRGREGKWKREERGEKTERRRGRRSRCVCEREKVVRYLQKIEKERGRNRSWNGSKRGRRRCENHYGELPGTSLHRVRCGQEENWYEIFLNIYTIVVRCTWEYYITFGIKSRRAHNLLNFHSKLILITL